MSMKILTVSLIVSLLIFFNLTENVQGDGVYGNVAEACKWLKKHIGYGCDGQAERWVWKTYMRFRYGVTDCNSFCQKYQHKKSGRCTKTSNYDTSSWCPKGQTCTCQ